MCRTVTFKTEGCGELLDDGRGSLVATAADAVRGVADAHHQVGQPGEPEQLALTYTGRTQDGGGEKLGRHMAAQHLAALPGAPVYTTATSSELRDTEIGFTTRSLPTSTAAGAPHLSLIHI